MIDTHISQSRESAHQVAPKLGQTPLQKLTQLDSESCQEKNNMAWTSQLLANDIITDWIELLKRRLGRLTAL